MRRNASMKRTSELLGMLSSGAEPSMMSCGVRRFRDELEGVVAVVVAVDVVAADVGACAR